jgi:pantothenate synthetase
MTLEYVSLADTADGQELGSRLGGEDTLVSIAVRLGEVKLIDNVVLASD